MSNTFLLVAAARFLFIVIALGAAIFGGICGILVGASILTLMTPPVKRQ